MDLAGLSIDRLAASQVDLARFARMAGRIYPHLPPWLQQSSSIYAIYALLTATLILTLLCYYTTLEQLLLGGEQKTHPAVLLTLDAVFSYLSFEILTA